MTPSSLVLRWARWMVRTCHWLLRFWCPRLFLVMMEKHADQFPIHGIKIAANDLQRWLILFWNPQNNFIRLTNSAPHVYLQLTITVRILLRVGAFLFQTLQCHAYIVAIFFKYRSHRIYVVRFKSSPRFIEFRVA